MLFESFNFPEFLEVIAFMIFNPTTIMQLAIYVNTPFIYKVKDALQMKTFALHEK